MEIGAIYIYVDLTLMARVLHNVGGVKCQAISKRVTI